LNKSNLTLVIGASADIGREVIRQIARPSEIILAHYHQSEAKLDDLKRASNAQIVPLQANLESLESTLALIARIKTEFGFPTQIIHLAAPPYQLERFKSISWVTIQNQFDIQLRSLFHVLQEFLPSMAAAKSGKVVLLLSSIILGRPPIGTSAYAITKHALLGLMHALATEYGGKGININAVSPSMVDTAFLENLPRQVIELAASQNPMGRTAQVSEVASVIKFLLSEQASFLNGVNIPVTGGESY